jgi:hypothetical protein
MWWGRWDLNLDAQAMLKEIIATFACSLQSPSLFLFSTDANLLGDDTDERESSKLSSLRENPIARFPSRKEARPSEMSNLRRLSNNKRLQTLHAYRSYSALPLQRLRSSIFTPVDRSTSSFFFCLRSNSNSMEERF